ncbi:MAG TPA: SpoIIE family protein phosphatase [Isosphaeraceae bacterium]
MECLTPRENEVARPDPAPEQEVHAGRLAGVADRARSARVLITDDHPANVEVLAGCLQHLGYEVVTSEGGQEALDLVAAGPTPDVILLDLMMPGLSGFEVLRRLRADSQTFDLPVILVSCLGETDDIVEGLRLGANDYVTKPINLPVLQARLETQTALKRARDDLKRLAQRLAAELEIKADQLRVASHVQRALLPRMPLKAEGLETAWCYEPATEVGGDLFDVIPLSGGRTLLFVADAMGHGVEAALVASTVKATLDAHLSQTGSLAALLGRLNEEVGILFEDRFVTAAACIVDPQQRLLRYAMAGHPPILVSGRSGVAQLRTSDLPLGMDPGCAYQVKEFSLDPGAAILLYSDGITEAGNPASDQFGTATLVEHFAALAGAAPEATIWSLRQAVDAFRGTTPLADDLTILAARLL